MAILPNPFDPDSAASEPHPDATEAAALLPPPVDAAAAPFNPFDPDSAASEPHPAAAAFPRGFDEAAFMAATTLPDLEHAEIIAVPIWIDDPSDEDLDALQVLAMRRAS